MTPGRFTPWAAGSMALTRVTENPPRPSGCVSISTISPGKIPSSSVWAPSMSKNCARGERSNRSPASTIKSRPTSPTKPSIRISSCERSCGLSSATGGPNSPLSKTSTSTATGLDSPNSGERVTMRTNAPPVISVEATGTPAKSRKSVSLFHSAIGPASSNDSPS